jgi:multidrug efflux system outer membrane protein
MSGRCCAAAAMLLLAGCAVGPAYRPAPVVPATTDVGVTRRADTTQAFFDSLAAARAADTIRPEVAPVSPRALAVDSLTDLAWLDVLHDTTLDRLVRTALNQNRTLLAVRAMVREYRAEYGVVHSSLFPSLTLNGSWSRNKTVFPGFAVPPYTAWRGTGDLAWELNFWGVGRGLQAAGADLAAREAAERAAVLTLVSDVATGYLQVLELDQERAIAEQTLSSSQATLALARERYAQGLISELDVRQFEAQVAVPAVRLAQVDQLRAVQEHALDVLLGEGPVPIPRGGSLAAAAQAVTVPDSVPASLIYRRPDVEQAEREYAAATARIGVAEAARLPTLSIIGSYGSQSTTPGSAFSANARVYEALVGVSIPLFTGGRLDDETRVARAQAEQAQAAYQQAVLTALEEAGDALSGVRAARDVAAAQQTQAAALKRALDLAELRYNTGLSNYLEVLDAQRSLFAAQLAASQAELQQLTAAVELYKALGGSWPGTLAPQR